MIVSINPGKYYLGDPSYVLHSKIYNGIWGNLYNFENGLFNIHNTHFVVHNTHYGDGTFTDTKKRTYKTITGVISLVNTELIENISNCKYGHIFNFTKTIEFIYDAGIFHIKSGKKFIQINTRNMEEYHSDFEEHCNYDYSNASDNDSIEDENDFEEDEYEKIDELEQNKKTIFFKKKL